MCNNGRMDQNLFQDVGTCPGHHLQLIARNYLAKILKNTGELAFLLFSESYRRKILNGDMGYGLKF